MNGKGITGLSSGQISATSTDAVNGSQLYATNTNVTNLTNTVNDITNGTAGLVQQDATSKAITVAKATNGTTVDFTGTAGARQLEGVAAGKADTDAVNLAQLKAAGLNVDTSGAVTNSFVAYDDATKGKITLAGGTAGTSITNVKAGALSAASTDAVNGSQLFATNANVTNVQNTMNNITNGNTGIKYFHVNSSSADSQATSPDGIAIGSTATTSGSSADSTDQIAIGTGAQTSYGKNIAIGGNAKALGGAYDGGYNVALGVEANASVNGVPGTWGHNTAIGAHTSITASNAVALGEGSVANRNSTVSVGSSTQQRQIANMAAGTADTDAVNVSQLKGVTTALGGGAAVNADGTIKAPAYTVQGQTKGDVGSALAAIDTATTGNTTSITNLTNNINSGTVGLVQQDATSKAITVAKGTAGTTVDFTGTAGTRQLKGVSKGTADTDAVNLAQLKAAGLNVDTSGAVTNSFVAYDDATKGKITLAGGAAGTTV
ncbi:MAG TPA: hypothetical protein VGN31_06260, partial [Paraburkholderia sp.]